MLPSLAGKSYIVTGAASGIGLATVKKLLGLSATVHALDRASAPYPTVEAPEKLHVYPNIDVSSREHISATFKTIIDRTPTIHGLVNAAGISPSGNYEKAGAGYGIEKDSTYEHVMDVNSRGTWNTVTELLHHTPLEGEANSKTNLSIVNIGSIASIAGIPTMAAYTASKHAVLGLTRTWALEYAARGIRANIILPGLVRTPLGMGAAEGTDERGDVAKAIINGIPMKRAGEPEELASSIVFLLSDESSYITGESITVGGGLPA